MANQLAIIMYFKNALLLHNNYIIINYCYSDFCYCQFNNLLVGTIISIIIMQCAFNKLIIIIKIIGL